MICSFRVRRQRRLLYSKEPGSSASASFIWGRWKYSVLHSKKRLFRGSLNSLGPSFMDREVGFLSSINGAARTSVSFGGTFGAGVTFSVGNSPPSLKLYATEA